jgi:2-polyprenyl-6-methoxyphenol hydroxylase-like FAD-dependent oxidoreductase
MATHSSDVVIVGGGITGTAVAYYLGKAGVKTTVIEKDSVCPMMQYEIAHRDISILSRFDHRS